MNSDPMQRFMMMVDAWQEQTLVVEECNNQIDSLRQWKEETIKAHDGEIVESQ